MHSAGHTDRQPERTGGPKRAEQRATPPTLAPDRLHRADLGSRARAVAALQRSAGARAVAVALQRQVRSATTAGERVRVVTYQGVRHEIEESQWSQFLAGLKRIFRDQVLRPLESRMDSASGLYDAMVALNRDQWAVAWFLEAVRTGVNLDEVAAPIRAGQEALQALRAVAAGDDLAATETATRVAEQRINFAHQLINEYRNRQIRTGELTVTALEVTSTVCFTIFALAGGAVLMAPAAVGGAGLGAVSAGAVVGGGTALLSSAANVGGKVVVGDEVGWTDLRTVALETVTGVAGGALGAGVAARLTPYIAPALTRSIIAGGLLRGVAEPALAATVNGVVAGSSAGAVQGAVMDGIRVLDGRATFEQLLRNVIANLIAGGIVGAVTGRLGGMPPGYPPPPPGGGTGPVPGGPAAQNVLVVGAETAGEFGWAADVAAAGQQVTVVNPVITPEAQAYAARGGTVVRGTVESLPQRPAYTMIREDFPFPLGRMFEPTVEFATARISRLAPGGRWVVTTESVEFAETLQGVAAAQRGTSVTVREVPAHHEGAPVSQWPRDVTRFILVVEKAPGR
ncbi:hypothetical protein Q5425_02915 [Amycolatopsis sp. A133]|uniref:hypothetical protein n=1 Tax=Amycolatopsis sp. A133 TaxID=3064472 RepID=UPI0027EA47A4|nr:hypothetical protein [Amycolatopsis sp. A133]MDQ7802667.1 hypothetical protein [Amycolatopsis sp. A133]